MKLYIKNMVCSRCIMVVQDVFKKLEHEAISVNLGEVELKKELKTAEKETLNQTLKSLGFELIDDKNSRMIEQIKTSIIEIVHQRNSELKTNLSDYLSHQLQHDYSSLSNLFSVVEGTTIEKYFISQKIEKVKELLIYDELSLSEIAFQLNYSSVAYLSNQFKRVTGLTPTYYKNMEARKRKPLDEV